ncbi:MAG: ammonium transporter [Lachnospiraceae bacterium]|jgi:Amt family ammonium transporter|nr:ammonium transporter [Lachnospiraceae bacterium]
MDFSIWFLIGAALVFFMQCGFAMVEAGFTRAKNTGNIIMKNLMDFCLGTVAFFLVGYNLLMGQSNGGFFGWGLNPITDFQNTDWSVFVFNLVFCATTATIVSGAAAERTKFISYCIYSVVISAVIYPIEAHWVWNADGWLAQMGFIDFAGSAAIHTVGGISGLLAAIFLGPRIGKYDENGKSRPILGHSIALGALGVFILWFGWYGFNGAAANNITQLAQIFATTTIAPAIATCVAMIFTWVKNGKPDVSMSLNGSLAGLVAVTAGCSNVDAIGAFFIGLVAGALVVGVVLLLENVLRIDDPVGAVAVHGACGIWGTLAVGLFDYNNGLFYGGGFKLFGIQVLGISVIILWTLVTVSILFFVISKTVGLRASLQEEIQGLDATEHGLESAYPDFQANNNNF